MNGCAGTEKVTPREPSVVQALIGEITSISMQAGNILDRVEGQRCRLLGDVPAATKAPERASPDNLSIDASVSFSDIGQALLRLRERMNDIDAHTAALRKIG